VNHNDDLKRLQDKGYAISIDSNYLVVRDIPYLDSNKDLQIGAIVTKLVFTDLEHVIQEDHQIFFCGSHPCQLDGSNIRNLGGGITSLQLVSPDVIVQRSFSNKPANGFTDFFEKIESYVTIISGTAIELYNVTPLTFNVYNDNSQSVFKVRDTLTSRAEIGDITKRFEEDVIAIIGLGGTGSYLLDFIVKTPVKEIRAFDLDWFHVHNAFRSPGKLEKEELGKRKTDVYQQRYEEFRFGVDCKSKFILSDSFEDMVGVTFAFVCVDKGSARKGIFELLIKMRIPFIDVGMGLDKLRGSISGTLRTTYFDPEIAEVLLEKKQAPMNDLPNDVYKTNIQISELNALNACLAIIKYKQIKGFYSDDSSYQHMLLTLDNFHLNGE
jgi:hypothetical protein